MAHHTLFGLKYSESTLVGMVVRCIKKHVFFAKEILIHLPRASGYARTAGLI